MNKFIGIGNLGNDPEPLTNGCKLSLAFKSFNGKEETVIWLKALVFGKPGENCLKALTKGRRISIEGRIDKSNNGETVIISDNVIFL